MAYQQSYTSPYERLVYGDDPMVQNALNAYANYQGSSLPSAYVSAPNLPGSIAGPNIASGNLSMNTKSAYVDPESAKFKVDQSALKSAAGKVTDFEIDPNDSVYAWKQQQARKNALKSLAGMGLSGSKYGINTMSDAFMKVMADESEAQYNRALSGFGVEKDMYGVGYQEKADLYNRLAEQKAAQYQRDYSLKSDNWTRSYQKAMGDYQGRADNWNRQYQGAMAKYQVASDNYNRAFQNASYLDNRNMNQILNTYNMANQIDNQRYGRMLDAVQIGAGAASSAGQNAMNSGSAIGGYQQQLGTNIGDNILAAGNAQSQYWSGLGAAANNALGMYYYGYGR